MKTQKLIKELLFILSGALVGAISTKYIIAPLKILSGGIYGLSLLLTRIKEPSLNTLFDAAYFANIYFWLNIPLILWGYFKLGKKIITYTLLNIFAFSIFVKFLPDIADFKITQDALTAVIVGAWLFGISSALIYKGNGSTGGLDLISIHITKVKKNFSVNNLNSIHTYVLFIFYQYAFNQKFGTPFVNNVLIYSIIFRFMVTLVANMMYQRHKNMLCTIISKEHFKLIDLIDTKFPHKGYSVYKVVGKGGKERMAIDIALSFYESKDLIKMLKDEKIDNFFYTTKVWKVHKNFAAIK